MRARLVLLAALCILSLGIRTDVSAKQAPAVRLLQPAAEPARDGRLHVDWTTMLDAPAQLERLTDKATRELWPRTASVISTMSRIVWSWIDAAVHLLLPSRFSN
jgi:hypothetical protein